MKVYVIVREGIYDRGIYGVYENIELAKKDLIEAKVLERDDYHTFRISEFTLNKNTKAKGYGCGLEYEKNETYTNNI